MCLNKPVKIPKGSDGASVYIAYAQDDSGSGFSYTPAESRNYISFVTKKGAVSQSDFTTWTLYQGEDGSDGSNGTGISNIYVSDGVTAIGGTVYTVNTVVVLMSTGAYINAGEVQLVELDWQDLVIINGFTAGTGVEKPQYAINNGLLYQRGTIDASTCGGSTAYITYANVTSGITNTVYTNISSTDYPSTVTRLEILATGDMKLRSAGSLIWSLDSISPISIR